MALRQSMQDVEDEAAHACWAGMSLRVMMGGEGQQRVQEGGGLPESTQAGAAAA